MRGFFAAAVIAVAALGASPAAVAQEAAPAQAQPARAPEPSLQEVELASKLIEVSGARRPFDELLPNIAERAKTTFIRSNPQMQLGIIAVVDKVALEMVERRAELDQRFARLWAIAFTEEELQTLIDFYGTETGKKLAALEPQIQAVEMREAENWAKSISEEMGRRVREELRTAVEAEARSLEGEAPQGEAAAPADPAPAPAQ